jgi:hypothetical protein
VRQYNLGPSGHPDGVQDNKHSVGLLLNHLQGFGECFIAFIERPVLPNIPADNPHVTTIPGQRDAHNKFLCSIDA